MEVTSDGDPVGYFWFSPMKSDRGLVVEMHTACTPGWEGRWLTRGAIRLGYSLLDRYGVSYVFAIHADPRMQRSLRKLGFTAGGMEVNTLNIKELEHGEDIGQRLWHARNS